MFLGNGCKASPFPFMEVSNMNWLSIVFVSVLCVYVVMWAIDRFVVTPRRINRDLPLLNQKMVDLEERVKFLEQKGL